MVNGTTVDEGSHCIDCALITLGEATALRSLHFSRLFLDHSILFLGQRLFTRIPNVGMDLPNHPTWLPSKRGLPQASSKEGKNNTEKPTTTALVAISNPIQSITVQIDNPQDPIIHHNPVQYASNRY